MERIVNYIEAQAIDKIKAMDKPILRCNDTMLIDSRCMDLINNPCDHANDIWEYFKHGMKITNKIANNGGKDNE